MGAAGVHAGYICPGPVDTDMMRRIEHDTFGDTMAHEEAEKVFAASALSRFAGRISPLNKFGRARVANN